MQHVRHRHRATLKICKATRWLRVTKYLSSSMCSRKNTLTQNKCKWTLSNFDLPCSANCMLHHLWSRIFSSVRRVPGLLDNTLRSRDMAKVSSLLQGVCVCQWSLSFQLINSLQVGDGWSQGSSKVIQKLDNLDMYIYLFSRCQWTVQFKSYLHSCTGRKEWEFIYLFLFCGWCFLFIVI